MESRKTLTTDSGAPVADNQNSRTAGPAGPVLFEDHQLIEKLAHFDRERIPERVVHAKGSGAFGYFEVLSDVTRWTKAKFLAPVGKRTEIFARFSTVAGEKGSADTVRDPRGFAIKFYTEDGNYDLVGNNTPVFFIRDPLKFPDFIHSQKRDPYTNIQEPDNVWDFFSLSPEATHQFTILFSDRGIPSSFRTMDGFGSHTFQWVNARGEVFWVKYHFKSDQGIRNLNAADAARIAGNDADYHQRDLLRAIDRAEYPSWTLKMQIMPEADAAKYRFNPFDVTKVWSHRDYPLTTIGRIVLNRNPENYFAEVEQAAFNPAHFVPGIGPSPDKMLQGRLFSYGDTHRYRLGANHMHLPVNRPHATRASNYSRDGSMRTDGNRGREKNYEPNSFGGSQQTGAPSWAPIEVAGLTGNHAPVHHRDDNDFVQAGDLYRLMSEVEKEKLIANIAASLSKVSRADIIERSLEHFRNADPEYGARLANELAKYRESRGAIIEEMKKENSPMKNNSATQTKHFWETPTDLSGDAVVEISGALRKLLADVFTLYVKTKNFHWHMSGKHFRDYHLLLDEQSAQIFAMTDEIAERARKIGGTTIHSIRDIAEHQRLKDNNAEFVPPHDMLVELRDDNQQLTRELRSAHKLCDERDDVATASLIENWIDETERRTWFLSEVASAR